jgi:DNA-binding XRE family transcriptional regulator
LRSVARVGENQSWRSAARRSPRVVAVLARLGRRVRRLRNERGLTQEDAAGKASLDPKHFQEIEAGRVNVTVASLVGIAKALGVTLAELFDGV